MEKAITLTNPIAVTVYGADEPVVYTKLVLTEYDHPHNQGMLLISDNDGETLMITTNLSYLIEPDIVMINVNNRYVEQQILPELIKRGVIAPEPYGAIKSGFVTYPAYELLVTTK